MRMTNNQLSNLRVLSPSEAREYGRRGGIASGEVRRTQKLIREMVKQTLNASREIMAGASTKQLIKAANEFKRGEKLKSRELEENE